MELTILIISLIFFLLIGLPIAYSIGFSSIIYLIVKGNIPLLLIPQIIANSLDSYNVIAIPFFILAAQIMNHVGVTDRLINFSNSLVGRLKGGLGHVNVLASMLFAGMSGSAVADSAGLGQILIPAMKKRGYSPAYSAAITAASSTIGPIIPPSVPMVMYGILAEVSIGKLFLAGAIPGIILGFSMLLLNGIMAHKYNFPAGEKSSIKEIIKSFFDAFLALLTPIILLGGMWAGIFSPTEAAAVAVGYAILQGIILKQIDFKKLMQALQEAAIYSVTIMFVVACASVFGWVLTTERIPIKFANWMLTITDNKYLILFILNIFLLIAGCFMEILSILLMMVPIITKLLVMLDIDLIHFGVVIVLNLMIGLLTPPFGICLFIAQDIAQISFLSAVKAIIPFLILIVIILFIITYIPQISLFLPNLLK